MSIKQHRGSTLDTGNTYFNDYTTTTSYVQISFGFPATKVSFVNDSNSNAANISWDGATLHYTIGAAEYKDIPAGGRTSVYVRSVAGTDKLRINAV
jgi:hypothetical protein